MFSIFLDIIHTNWHVILLFFTVAVLYASVGFGGGSSYLAILALTGIAFTQIRATALLCNIIVVLGNVFWYQKNSQIDWKKTIPLVFCSIPLAFLGGYLKIDETIFFILLGITLIVVAVMMLLINRTSEKNKKNELHIGENIFFGSFIGFISGLVGIGGGIFLAPLLHLTNWDTAKKIAATASFFILVNSISGLLGQFSNHDFDINWHLTSFLLMTVLIGGQIGSRLSNKILTAIQLKRITAILVAIVGLRILIKYIL